MWVKHEFICRTPQHQDNIKANSNNNNDDSSRDFASVFSALTVVGIWHISDIDMVQCKCSSQRASQST